MQSETHLFIIWEKARYLSEKIISDIKTKFQILQIYDITWSKEKFNNNLTRFYNENLPPDCDKETHCGNGPFLLIVVKDEKPFYGYRSTSKGPKYLNINMFDAKNLYREWTGGGHKIHCTNTSEETQSDLTLLLGKNVEDYLNSLFDNWDGNVKKITQNLVGENGWDSIEQLFYVLNTTCNYVVLRNYECLPNEYNLEGHGDIDLLTDNLNNLVYISNAKKVYGEKYRVHYKVKIANEDVLFDFRYVGDKYYDEIWEKTILETKKFTETGIYTPSLENYFYTLLYHGLIHKKVVSDDYIKKLRQLSAQMSFQEYKFDFDDKNICLKKILYDYLRIKKYNFVRPIDKTVMFNIKNIFGYKKSFYNKYIKVFLWPINKIYAEIRRFAKKSKLVFNKGL